MDIKAYLSQIFTLQKLINAKRTRIQHLQEMRESIAGGTPKSVKVQTSVRIDTICDFTSKILDAEKEVKEDISKMLLIQKEIEETIDLINNHDSKLIMYERYVNMKNWENIAFDNNYSVRWVHVLHKRGLKEIENMCSKVHCSSRM